MTDEKHKVVKVIEHPLEEYFEIDSGSTEVEVFDRSEDGELITATGYDDKDGEIDKQFEEVYDSAMEGYDLLSEELHTVEGKYKARVGEVSVQHLNTALNAAAQKARLKEHKDKLESKGKTPTNITTNNTLIVDDRSALLDQLRKGMEEDKDKIKED